MALEFSALATFYLAGPPDCPLPGWWQSLPELAVAPSPLCQDRNFWNPLLSTTWGIQTLQLFLSPSWEQLLGPNLTYSQVGEAAF